MAKKIKLKNLIKESYAFSTVGGLVTQRSINPISVPGMSELVEGEWFGEDKKRIDAGAFIEEVKKFSRMGEWIYREGSLRDVAKGLSELADKARRFAKEDDPGPSSSKQLQRKGCGSHGIRMQVVCMPRTTFFFDFSRFLAHFSRFLAQLSLWEVK